MAQKNKKSDVKAKAAFKAHLEKLGYSEVKIVGTPCDIIAKKDGYEFFFEVKMTKQIDTYFGAATLTEWIQALKTPDKFKFVIAKTDESEEEFKFIEYTPEEFMKHSTIPPFKIYFNIKLDGKTPRRSRRKAISLTKDNMKLLTDLHEKIRE